MDPQGSSHPTYIDLMLVQIMLVQRPNLFFLGGGSGVT